MMDNETLVEWNARVMQQARVVEAGVIERDPYTYQDGITAKALRSGVDGPYADRADRLCNLNGRLYE